MSLLSLYTLNELEIPSFETAQTTLRLVLLIYSFLFRSAFPPRCQNRFFHSWVFPVFHFDLKRNTFSRATLIFIV